MFSGELFSSTVVGTVNIFMILDKMMENNDY